MRVVVDTKNLALYSSGIAQYFGPLLGAWIRHRSADQFFLIGPEFDRASLDDLDNWEHIRTDWPVWLPRPLRHPFYDNVLFPRALRKARADFVFSPYHDVRVNGQGKKVIMIHDTCLEELATTYPRRIRWYFLVMLRHNLRRADHVVTVSQSSRNKIVELYGVAADSVHVVYNTCHPEFSDAKCDASAIQASRTHYTGKRLLLYPGGSEYRKNVSGLLHAFASLVAAAPGKWVLLVTGEMDARWDRFLGQHDPRVAQHVVFLGRLSYQMLKEHYCAADTVVYPTLCEGFGRVCLESMVTGAPLACSDLPVLREVAGDYAQYFDPRDPAEIEVSIRRAVAAGRAQPVFDQRFDSGSVRKSFLELMDRLIAMPASA